MTRRRMLLGRLAGVCLAAALCLGAAQGAVYDASTGYVTLVVNGSTGSDSPMSMTKAEDSASTASNRKYFWSDHLPMHAGTTYYVNTWFRTVIETVATTSHSTPARTTTRTSSFAHGRASTGRRRWI